VTCSLWRPIAGESPTVRSGPCCPLGSDIAAPIRQTAIANISQSTIWAACQGLRGSTSDRMAGAEPAAICLGAIIASRCAALTLRSHKHF